MSYGPGKTTAREFVITLTGDDAASQSANITLPAGADTITIWVRFSCSDPNGKVALSGVALEDITAAGVVEPAPAVIQKERDKEKEFLQGVESALRYEESRKRKEAATQP